MKIHSQMDPGGNLSSKLDTCDQNSNNANNNNLSIEEKCWNLNSFFFTFKYLFKKWIRNKLFKIS